MITKKIGVGGENNLLLLRRRHEGIVATRVRVTRDAVRRHDTTRVGSTTRLAIRPHDTDHETRAVTLAAIRRHDTDHETRAVTRAAIRRHDTGHETRVVTRGAVRRTRGKDHETMAVTCDVAHRHDTDREMKAEIRDTDPVPEEEVRRRDYGPMAASRVGTSRPTFGLNNRGMPPSPRHLRRRVTSPP